MVNGFMNELSFTKGILTSNVMHMEGRCLFKRSKFLEIIKIFL